MKQRNSMIVGSLVLGGILVFSLYGLGNSLASSRFERDHDDGYEYGHNRSDDQWKNAGSGPQYSLYTEECGSCHIAYPRDLLPVQSWHKIMTGLENHFDENAELDKETRQKIEGYLTQPGEENYSRMLRNIDGAIPLRITELPHFRHEHDEIPIRFIEGNERISSLSQCNACHRNAEKGWFDEDNVVIPGVGRWDD